MIQKVCIPIIIPSYEPDHNLIDIVDRLQEESYKDIIIVNDGSDAVYEYIYSELVNKGCILIKHGVNLGKGRSLKDAFNYVLCEYPNAIGVITADSDGQHTLQDISKCIHTLITYPESLVLGCREFESKYIPWKSKLGNELTKKSFRYLCGINVSDTQTGLRGIPRKLMCRALAIKGERFDYETNMLIEAHNEFDFTEVKIQTIYDSKINHKTHFDPLRDSAMIYKVIFSYLISSIFSVLIDFCIFSLCIHSGINLWVSTVWGRLSATVMNFKINRNIVFKCEGDLVHQLLKYIALVIISGTISAVSVFTLLHIWPRKIILLKTIVEGCLFFMNYYVQQTFVFSKKKPRSIKNMFKGGVMKETDWTAYYKQKRNWISTYTQKFTLEKILQTINAYVSDKDSNGIKIVELGGGNSCFAKSICETQKVNTYNIIDNNDLAVKLFNKQKIAAMIHSGFNQDLLKERADSYSFPKYDFVFSVGLIEHFCEKDIGTIIRKHFEYCKPGGGWY